MGAEHTHGLHLPGQSTVHRLPAHLKIVSTLAFVLLVVATPREATWPYAVHLAALMLVARTARVPAAYLATRLVVEVPFVVFAVVLPFVATGPRISVLGLSVSEPGLVAAWALLAKGTLGVLAALLLAATTEPRDLLTGLTRLRLPRQLVEIMGFMVRYVEVVTGDLRRMSIALASRGFDARSPRQWPVLATCLGALFVRSYERGERVHLAMLSRGYAGSLPVLDAAPLRVGDLVAAAALPTMAAVGMGAAVLTR
ncbi:MAG TPA: cobalt ECF transporter T component CbiQ [Dermatophilaceae bacterium]|nr:cobalt ECF transporter T component CbiQ [Dermatophilaceae bacterium]